jgi:pyridoxamine 5'-phosphate oxidase
MPDPIYLEALQRFESLLERAKQTSLREPTAVTLATVDTEARPSARVVLLRGFDERGFAFYTNSQSKKGLDLTANPVAALCFFWDELREQVRVQGTVEIVGDTESDEYWQTRARESQIGAWASAQSERLDNRETLEARFAECERRFADQSVPRPEHWHGYRVVADRIEFWTGRDARLHDREVYERASDGWSKYLLYP